MPPSKVLSCVDIILPAFRRKSINFATFLKKDAEMLPRVNIGAPERVATNGRMISSDIA